jgi:hypothetical protein
MTAISFGGSMNIHFDLDDLGSQGLTFVGNQRISTSHEVILLVLGVAERFTGPDIVRLVPGECSIEFHSLYNPRAGEEIPLDKTRRIICSTEDRQYSATAE